MDTNSLYMGISSVNFEDIIKPEYMSAYKNEVYESCQSTPGIFSLENAVILI